MKPLAEAFPFRYSGGGYYSVDAARIAVNGQEFDVTNKRIQEGVVL